MNIGETATSLVVGAGGLGEALAFRLKVKGPTVVWSRATGVDTTIEDDIERAACALENVVLARVFVTTGFLHSAIHSPERSWRDLDRSALEQSFLVNAIAPALVAKHILPRLPRDKRAVFAVLGARVGSIGDNRSGGWHGYRASKAALAMLIKTLSIELKRTHPSAICVALHPGTVDTGMSKPFQGNVPPGKLFTPDFAAERLIEVVDALTPADSGAHIAWDGELISA